jgi:RNA polymerase sigma-70 factor (ECF subfamily)
LTGRERTPTAERAEARRLERFAAGELDAFETLFRQFQGDVYRWIVRVVRDPSAAEELTVECFWRIYRARFRFDPGRNFGPWARRIAGNVALDHLKAAPRELPLPERSELPATAQADPALHDAIRRAFAALPPRLRVVATLALVEGETQAEIARSLGISVGAVKSREFRAVRLLRRALDSMGVRP